MALATFALAWFAVEPCTNLARTTRYEIQEVVAVVSRTWGTQNLIWRRPLKGSHLATISLLSISG